MTKLLPICRGIYSSQRLSNLASLLLLVEDLCGKQRYLTETRLVLLLIRIDLDFQKVLSCAGRSPWTTVLLQLCEFFIVLTDKPAN